LRQSPFFRSHAANESDPEEHGFRFDRLIEAGIVSEKSSMDDRIMVLSKFKELVCRFQVAQNWIDSFSPQRLKRGFTTRYACHSVSESNELIHHSATYIASRAGTQNFHNPSAEFIT
jgi:hypothetical protein